MYRIGNSIDIHPLVKNKPLYIGGVLIPSEYGSVSHSDGDALLHALAEAILGALGEGDLGQRYPDNDDKYLNMPSSFFIKDCKLLLDTRGYKISNIDIMIVLEKPKLEEYKEKVKENIAKLLDIDISKVNIKAGTNEKIGSIGEGKSYLVWVSLLIEK